MNKADREKFNFNVEDVRILNGDEYLSRYLIIQTIRFLFISVRPCALSLSYRVECVTEPPQFTMPPSRYIYLILLPNFFSAELG